MKILLPLAGPTPFFPPEDFPFPKPLIEIDGRPMIQHVVDNLRGVDPEARFVFIAMQNEAARYSYPAIFDLITEGRSDVVLLRNTTAGALCSCLMAVDHIDLDEPLIIANSDQVIQADLAAAWGTFKTLDADAGVITFASTHPRWSYVKTDGALVEEASEKRVISRNAVAGFYYFKQGRDFIAAAEQSILADDSKDGVFYVAPCLNQMILTGKRVAVHSIDAGDYHSFYLPSGVDAYARMIERREWRKPRGDWMPDVSVVIPAAGQGSRFANAGYAAPKPFIDIENRAMIEHVIDNVALPNANVVVLLQNTHIEAFPAAALGLIEQGVGLERVRGLTEGTACTVLLARRHFDNDHPLLIANSDQLVDFSCEAFVRDALARGLDGSILVFRDPTLNPKWSFARCDDQGFVVEVAEKKPISDLATVGIYFFTQGAQFVAAALDMIVANDRVNNEFYTCPVYNYMIRQGLKIGVYEVDQNAMHGLGVPEDLTAFLEARGSPPSAHAPTSAPS